MAGVETAGEPVGVSLDVLRAHVVEGAVVAALEQRPERFDAVGGHVASDVFVARGVDRRVVRETSADGGLIGVDSQLLSTSGWGLIKPKGPT